MHAVSLKSLATASRQDLVARIPFLSLELADNIIHECKRLLREKVGKQKNSGVASVLISWYLQATDLQDEARSLLVDLSQ
jgi:hypothetical protein